MSAAQTPTRPSLGSSPRTAGHSTIGLVASSPPVSSPEKSVFGSESRKGEGEDGGSKEVIRAECGEAFWLELRQQLWKPAAQIAQMMGKDRRSVHVPLALYQRLLPIVRGRLAFFSAPKPPEPVSRVITLFARGSCLAVHGWSLDLASVLVAVRDPIRAFTGDSWLLVHVASGVPAWNFAAASRHVAADFAARAEAACPAAQTIDAADPDSLTALRDELAAFEKTGGK